MAFDTSQAAHALLALPDGTIDTDGERALWAAVLAQAVHDATRPHVRRDTRGAQGGTSLEERTDARAFLEDVKRVGPICELLGIDPAWWQRKTRAAGSLL